PFSNELTAIHSLADTAGFLKKTGNGAYSIDVNSYLNLTGGTLTGTLVSTAPVASTSTTTGAIVASSLGISGAIFAGTLNGNGSGITDIKANNISSGTMPYQRINMTESAPPINDSSPAVNTICNMGVSYINGYPLTGHLFSSVASSIRGIQILSNPLAPEFSYIRSRHTNFPTGWSPWQKIAIENLSGRVQSTSGFSVGGNQVVSARRT
ncbi:hypothetical protein, partial [Planktothrix sp.]|uniref:hypothetical protein n=1 Tax=Planktothrix sp. TaxID=3088171 RepID=UPI0038D43C27